MMNPTQMAHNIARAIECAGGAERLNQAIEAHARSRDYLTKHYADLLAQYPEHWIAVRDSEVVAAELTLKDLAAKLAQRELSVSELAIRHMTTRPKVHFTHHILRR